VQTEFADMPNNPLPALLEPRAIEIMRSQREDMALMQGCGNLLNHLILKGISPEEIATQFGHHISCVAAAYERQIGRQLIQKKAAEINDRLAFLRP